MRVLVVEDEPNIASYLGKTLRVAGFKVDWASNGADALELMLSQEYDAVSLDVMLPGMDGYSVCRKAREHGLETPILMLTARDGEADEVLAFECGADDFLRKPFSTAVLTARLTSLARRGSTLRGDNLRVGDLELDRKTQSARRGGHSIALTAREYSLLEMLMRHAGETVSKSDIMQTVWGVDYRADDNVVEVYIGYLRKKVDAPFEGKLIRTVRGRGYLIDASPKAEEGAR